MTIQPLSARVLPALIARDCFGTRKVTYQIAADGRSQVLAGESCTVSPPITTSDMSIHGSSHALSPSAVSPDKLLCGVSSQGWIAAQTPAHSVIRSQGCVQTIFVQDQSHDWKIQATDFSKKQRGQKTSAPFSVSLAAVLLLALNFRELHSGYRQQNWGMPFKKDSSNINHNRK